MAKWIYEWDSAKDALNIEKHGFSFTLSPYVFLDKNRTEIIDDRQDYGEVRYLTYGLVENRVFCVCYTIRKNIRRIISLRPVHEKEKRLAYDNHQND